MNLHALVHMIVGADAHIGPADCTVFTEICGEFATSRWAGRVVGPYNSTALSVGADDSVRPQDAPVFTETFGEFTAAQRADVGIAPYGQIEKYLRIRRKASAFRICLPRLLRPSLDIMHA